MSTILSIYYIKYIQITDVPTEPSIYRNHEVLSEPDGLALTYVRNGRGAGGTGYFNYLSIILLSQNS